MYDMTGSRALPFRGRESSFARRTAEGGRPHMIICGTAAGACPERRRGAGGATLELGGAAGREYDWGGRCHENNSVHLYCCIDAGVGTAECFGGTAGAGGETVGKCGGEVCGTACGAGTGREERAGVFGDVLVSERRRICAGDGRGGGSRHRIRFAIRRWRERQGSVPGSVFQEREA